VFLGARTLDETRDLLAVADYRFKETGKAYDALVTKPQDLVSDWIALQEKWKKARSEIAASLTAVAIQKYPLPIDMIRTQDEWDRIEKFIQYQEQDPKSLQGISLRIEKARGFRAGAQPNDPLLYAQQPPPTAKSDVDLALFKQLDSTIKAGEQGAAEASKKAGQAAANNWPWIVGGTVVGTVVLLGAAKIYLRK
jgi:hypothetical protein